ncbi:unnamed protein product [Dibothriocephalus latus]|uniref:Rho-GAP domain-containing protein n=1 Tax=Dibothriocephalus latus TaxID=60516 RepID=A0A3P7LF72_DIBLA|nr:unnamed protein product [Dibothriocephalus latus]
MQGVPEILVELVKALRDHGLDIEGIYRVPGRSSRLHNFINYVNANPSVVSGNLAVATEPETLDSRTISSAIKRFLSLLPESVLNAEELLCAINERLDDREAASLTPVKLARILMAMRTFLEQKFEEVGVSNFALVYSGCRKWLYIFTVGIRRPK